MSPRVLFLEPWYGGSHEAFADTLADGLPYRWTRLTLPARHWKWRMRGSAVWFAQELGEAGPFDLVLASSFVPLAELVGLVPRLADVPRVLYFHENQWSYPNREEFSGERDLHFGITQAVSCLAATRVCFNSEFNRHGFLGGLRDWLRRMPDARPRGWVEQVTEKSAVLPVPLDVPESVPRRDHPRDPSAGPVILWNHRMEHDKDPEAFFRALGALRRRGVPFRLIVCGREGREVPPAVAEARASLADHVLHWGEAPPELYRVLLAQADLVVSTAWQEFFGLSVLEAVGHGACPVVPDRLSYPDLYPAEYRYRDEDDLADMLARRAEEWAGGRDHRQAAEEIVAPLRKEQVLPRYREFLAALS